jgi:anti-sigma28 factor (negative regulator of flagellin synthesis)
MITPLSQAQSPTPSSRIGPIEYSSAPAPRRPGENTTRESETDTVQRGEDRVELSSAAREAQGSSQPIRSDLVTRVRQELAAGTYETPEKLEIAVRRAVRELDATA